MKRYLLPALLTLVLAACTHTSEVRDAVADHLRSAVPGADNFDIEVIADTVPYYLNAPLLEKAQSMIDMQAEYECALQTDSVEAMKIMLGFDALQGEIAGNAAVARASSHSKQSIALARYTTPGDTAARAIVIVDYDDPARIVDTFIIDSNFAARYISVRFANNDFSVGKLPDGRPDTSNLPAIDAFILSR